MKERMKNQNGITLIALIITIVVLLILAVVAINSIQNDGIISHAGNTANTYNQSVLNEQEHLDNYLSYLDRVQGEVNGGSKTYKAYGIGDTVTVVVDGVEHNFYVIADSDEKQETVVLLAEKCIEPDNTKSDYLKQSSEASTIAFSQTNYWSTLEGITYPYDLTEKGVPDESHYAARIAYNYGVELGGIGRLIKENEISNLLKDSKNNDMVYGVTGSKLAYLIGAAIGNTNVWLVVGDYGKFDTTMTCAYNTPCYVRPVVEISKSKVQ